MYPCLSVIGKASTSDRKIWKQLDVKYSHKISELQADEPFMPSSPNNANTLTGIDTRLASLVVNGINLRTFSYMVSTMNLLFPDYDFSDVDPIHFQRHENLDSVINDVNTTLLSTGITKSLYTMNEISHTLWSAIDNAVSMNDCEIFSFDPEDPDRNEDPFKTSCMY